MQISIPIKQLAKDRSLAIEVAYDRGRDIWDCIHDDFGVYSALDFWARDEYYVDTHHPETHIDIPRAVQLGHGNMHLNSWFAPEELINVSGKPSFEVKLNVSDLKPEELNVKLNEEERVLTIEGQHEHHEHQDPEDHRLAQDDSVRMHFKRSVTLPVNVLEKKLECSLTPGGHHLVLTAPVKILPALELWRS